MAVRKVDLAVESGECRVIIGPNGAGKTTLFNLLTGVERPTAGRLALYGEDITHMPVHLRAARGLARTFQITSLFPRLTVEENVLLAAQAQTAAFVMHRRATQQAQAMAAVERHLENGGLAQRRHVPVRFLSYGEQRELEVVLALAMEPKILLLDEPTAGLSEAERKSITAFLRELRGTITIVLVSHDLDVGFALADRVTVLHLGQVLIEGSVDEVRGDPRVSEIYLGDEREHLHA